MNTLTIATGDGCRARRAVSGAGAGDRRGQLVTCASEAGCGLRPSIQTPIHGKERARSYFSGCCATPACWASPARSWTSVPGDGYLGEVVTRRIARRQPRGLLRCPLHGRGCSRVCQCAHHGFVVPQTRTRRTIRHPAVSRPARARPRRSRVLKDLVDDTLGSGRNARHQLPRLVGPVRQTRRGHDSIPALQAGDAARHVGRGRAHGQKQRRRLPHPVGLARAGSGTAKASGA